MMMKYLDFWQGDDGVFREYPKGRKYPDPRMFTYVKNMIVPPVCDVGCGSGRFTSLFPCNAYLGVDVNATAIEKARMDYPKYMFQVVSADDPLPQAHTYLFSAVLMHLPESALEQMVEKCKSGRAVVILETMDVSLGDGKFVFGRNRDHYSAVFARYGFQLVEERRMYMDIKPFYFDIQKYEHTESYNREGGR